MVAPSSAFSMAWFFTLWMSEIVEMSILLFRKETLRYGCRLCHICLLATDTQTDSGKKNNIPAARPKRKRNHHWKLIVMVSLSYYLLELIRNVCVCASVSQSVCLFLSFSPPVGKATGFAVMEKSWNFGIFWVIMEK